MFQSLTFWVVLAAAVAVFWQLPERFRFAFLAIVSYVYLATLEPVGVTLLIAWVLLFFYVAPRAIAEKRHAALVLPGLVGLILTYLIGIKYVPPFLEWLSGTSTTIQILAPLGLSYFTFKLIHYAVETARGTITDRSLPRFFCYIFLFPIFTAGPIERFDHFVANTETDWDWDLAVQGITRIVYGLIKFFVLTELVDPFKFGGGVPGSNEQLFNNFDTYAWWGIWIYLILTYLYLYLDFSAYSDIAIGASRLFGFKIMENFNWPIIAENISDFWRRWHMTLSNWCQTYIYMPVYARTRMPYLAIFATFVLMGAWHGATAGWLMYGVYHAIGVSIYTAWARHARQYEWWRTSSRNMWRYTGVPITFLFVASSYAFAFTGGGFYESLKVYCALFGIRLDV